MPSENASRTSGEPEISVVIPAFNEEACLRATLTRIISYLRERVGEGSWEIIIVDDGSHDRTREVAGAFYPQGVRLLSNPVNMGKGYSVKKGVLSARGEFVLFTDADLSTPIEEMEGLISAIRSGSDIAIASRALPQSRILKPQPLGRVLLGRVFLWFVHLMNLKDFSDTQCGFKAFRREAALTLFRAIRIEGYAFDVELLLLARRMSLKVAQVPVSWRDSDHSTISVFSPRAMRMLWDIFLLRWRRF